MKRFDKKIIERLIKEFGKIRVFTGTAIIHINNYSRLEEKTFAGTLNTGEEATAKYREIETVYVDNDIITVEMLNPEETNDDQGSLRDKLDKDITF